MNFILGLVLAEWFSILCWNAYAATTITVCEDIEVTISVEYVPPSNFNEEMPNYYAASAVNLTCNANGASEDAKFQWTSTCNGTEPCFVSNQTTRMVRTSNLHPYDAGVHTCIVSDSRGCQGRANITMNVIGYILKVEVEYTPPDQYPNYNQPAYRAASSVTLHCVAEGTVGEVRFQWSSTCDGCFASNSTSPTISESLLSSRDAGAHTCTTTDSTGYVQSDSVNMEIVGAGIFVIQSEGYGGHQAAQPNNTYVIADTGQSTATTRLSLYCCSNSTSSSIGSFTFPNGHITSIDYNSVSIDRHIDDLPGCILFHITAATYISYHLHENEGLFTCNIPDSTGRVNHVSFALYNKGYSSIPSKHYYTMKIHHHNNDSSLSINCGSYGFPPVSVTWLFKGEVLEIDGNKNRLSQQILDRGNQQFLHSLTIHQHPFSVTGNYTCIIGNKFGRTVDSLVIKGIQIMATNSSTVGDSWILKCASDLNVTTLELNRNGRILSSSKSSTTQFTLNPVSTDDEGADYMCRAVTSNHVEEKNITLSISVPSEWAKVEIVNSTSDQKLYVHNGTNYDLVCTITPIRGMRLPLSSVEWVHPNGSVLTTDGSTNHSVGNNGHIISTLKFVSISTTDGGVYTCRASVNVPWVTVQPPLLTATVNLIVTTINVSIDVTYNPPDQYPDYGPPNYRAASTVTLRCVADWNSTIQYQWTSTCDGCFASSSTSQTITENILRSGDAGVHTCAVADGKGNVGSASTIMNIVGAGIYVVNSRGYGGRYAAQSNNTYVTVRNGRIRGNQIERVALHCCSNSTDDQVGSITFSQDGRTRSNSYFYYKIEHFRDKGCLYFSIIQDGYFGLGSEAGLFTCNIRDATGRTQHVNFGLYDEGYRNTPNVTSIGFTIMEDRLVLTAFYTTLPETVRWLKNDDLILIDGSNTVISNRLVNRRNSRREPVYESTLVIRDNSLNVLGEYTLSVGDTLGFDSSKRSVSVEGVRVTQLNTRVRFGDRVTLRCTSDLPDVVLVEWIRNGMVLSSSSGNINVLTIDSITSTDDGGNYVCKITTPRDSLMKNTTVRIDIPYYWVNTIEIVDSIDNRQYATNGTNYTLVCSIRASSLIRIPAAVEWLAPNGRVIENQDNVIISRPDFQGSNTTSRLSFAPVMLGDGGSYTCRASLNVPWDPNSSYRIESAHVDMTVGLRERKVSIRVNYTTPDQYPEYRPPNYRAASSVTLHCVAEGTSGTVRYQWSSTCDNCFASRSTSPNITETILKTGDAGVHTCSVTDDTGVTQRASLIMSIVGAGIYVRQSVNFGGEESAQPNNTFVTIDSGFSGRQKRLELLCCSNSTRYFVGSFIFPDGIVHGYDFAISIQQEYSTGCVMLSLSTSQNYFLRENSRSGIFTCNITDSTETSHYVSFGLFDEDFSGAPHITGVEHAVFESGIVLSCESDTAPPTNITWLKNGDVVSIDGNTSTLSQDVLNRPSSIFQSNLKILGNNPYDLVGNYSCIVVNKFGGDRESLLIETIKISAASDRYTVGRTESLLCDSDISYAKRQWIKEGNITLITAQGSPAALILDPVSTDDEGSQYICRVSTVYKMEDINYTISVDVPDVWADVEIRYTTNHRVYELSGNNHTLTCVVRNIDGMNIVPSIDWIDANGAAVESGHNNTVAIGFQTEGNTTTSTLTFSPIVTSDSGVYTCRATVHVPWMSFQPPPLNSSIDLHVIDRETRTVTIQVQYIPPDQYPDYGPPNYRAASSVTLQCVAEGTIGPVQYQWTSTCSNCFASNSTSSNITSEILSIHDIGTHTCTVSDSYGVIERKSMDMNIVGAGIYVTHGRGYGGQQAAQPNNSYIIVHSGYSNQSTRFRLLCCSNASAGSPIAIRYPDGRVAHSSTGASGCTFFRAQVRESAVYYLRVSGIHICQIPDSTGRVNNLTFGLYNGNFRSLPNVTAINYEASDTSLVLTCKSDSAPPTNVSWIKDGNLLTPDENTLMTKRIENYLLSAYSTTLRIALNSTNPFQFIGEYRCIIGNKLGNSFRAVTVRGLRVKSSITPLTVGQPATFTCESEFTAKVEWRLYNKLIAKSSNQSNAVFTIDTISTNHDGTYYTCRVENDYGFLEENVTLSVEVPNQWATLMITNSPQQSPSNSEGVYYVLSGTNDSLTCTVKVINGIEIRPTIEWLNSSGTVVESGGLVTRSDVQHEDDVSFTSTLSFSPILATDEGLYTCRASLSLPTMSTQLPSLTDSVNMIVVASMEERKVNVTVEYTSPDQNPKYRSPNYRAASSVTLYCVAEGTVGNVHYQWSSTCKNCFASNSSLSSISKKILRSHDAGLHTCVVWDGFGMVGSKTVEMNIVGAGVYVQESLSHGGLQQAQPNNTYITVPHYPPWNLSVVDLYCCSNSTFQNVGSFTFPDGRTVSTQDERISGLTFKVDRNDVGCIRLRISGVVRYQRVQLRGNTGIVTCNIPDATGSLNHVSFGIFNYNFDSSPNLVQLKHTSINSSLVLTCESDGAPPTNVTWTKNGNRLDINSSYANAVYVVQNRQTSSFITQLTLNPTLRKGTLDLIGSYSCAVGNLKGSDVMQTTVEGIRLLSNTTQYVVGQNASITCESDLTVRVEWTRANQLLSRSNAIESFAVLSFSPISTDHHGMSYACRVSDGQLDSIVRNVTIEVQVPDMWATVNVTRTVKDSYYVFNGTNATLVCTVMLMNGITLPPSIEWYNSNNDVLVSDSVGRDMVTQGVGLSTVSFEPAVTVDEGKYTCRASIIVPWMSSQPPLLSDSVELVVTTLRVNIQVIYTPPDQYPDYRPPNYRAASSVTLRCVAEGTVGAVQYQWLSTCSNCFADGATSATISEEVLTTRDAGVHVCNVLDSVGSTGSNSTAMNIVGAGIYVSQSQGHSGLQPVQPNNTIIIVDTHNYQSRQRVSLYCCSNSGRRASFTFPSGYTTHPYDRVYYVFSILYHTERYQGCTQLFINNTNSRFDLNSETSGVYTCNIPYASGEMAHISFGLYSEGFSAVPAVNSLEHATSDTTLSLRCLSGLSPPANITWFKNGNAITIDGNATQISYEVVDRYVIRNVFLTTLTIQDHSPQFIGNYTCNVGNTLGNSSRTVTIKALRISRNESQLVVGDAATISCTSDLSVTAVEWRENATGVLVSESEETNSAQLVLDPITSDEWGTSYTCKVIGNFGISDESITLYPEVPSQWASIAVSNSTNQSAMHEMKYQLICTIEAIAGLNISPSIEWIDPNGNVIKNSYRITVYRKETEGTKTTSTLSFGPVLSNDGGVYSCKAAVDIPWSSPPPSTMIASVNMVVQSQAKFQLQLLGKGPLLYCTNFDRNALHLETAIKRSIETGVKEQCNCEFSKAAIHSGRFSCSAQATSVMYRAVIEGSSDFYTAQELIHFIDRWRRRYGTVFYLIFELKVAKGRQCPIGIESFTDPEC